MLVVMYIISAAASILSAVFEQREDFKKRSLCTIIAIGSSFAFYVPVIREILSNSVLDFWLIFAVLSLAAWHFAFLRNDIENIINYEVASFLFTVVFYIFCYVFFFSDNIVSCTTDHITTEIIPIITTVDGTESGKSIYGDGFLIGLINDPFSKDHMYQYYYRTENGLIASQNVDYKDATIVYIDNTVSPYVEVTTVQNCFGYTRISKKHKITGSSQTYILYIQEGSIKQIVNTD